MATIATSLAFDNDVWETHSAAESGKEDDKLNGVNIVHDKPSSCPRPEQRVGRQVLASASGIGTQVTAKTGSESADRRVPSGLLPLRCFHGSASESAYTYLRGLNPLPMAVYAFVTVQNF